MANPSPSPSPTRSALDQAGIARLVDRFYDKVSGDPMLGAIFNPRIEDWNAHKRLLASFWSSVALRAGSYRGNPMAKHNPLPIGNAHFERWLDLWRQTVPEVLDDAGAETMIEYAERIGRGLRMGMGLGDRPRARELGIPLARVPRTDGQGH
jgi:hemoglobin